MGDVVTALGRAVQEEDHDVMVVLPKYDVLNYDEARFSAHKQLTWLCQRSSHAKCGSFLLIGPCVSLAVPNSACQRPRQ